MKTLKNLTLAFTLLTATFSMANTNNVTDDVVYFAGEAQETSNTLTFVSITAVKSNIYSLEKSSDAINFFKVTSTTKDGEEEASHEHKYEDQTPNSLTYYRLASTDLEGNTTYSDLIVVLNKNAEEHQELAETLRD